MTREVLIVEDEDEVRAELRVLLEDASFSVREARDEAGALSEVSRRRPTLILLDIWLGKEPQGGIRVLERLRERDLRIPVVIISGHGTIETAVSSIKLGASDFVEKPFRSDQLLHVIRRAMESDSLRRENRELRLRAGPEQELTGDSAVISALREAVGKVAVTGSRVLVTGPAGAGKEVTARQLHLQSGRSEGPFVAVHCALMHPERIEAELFGVEGGGADSEHAAQAGLFEQAHGGTLFLDEVADMPLETQGKIVRVLQEQRFHRLGGVAPIEVDVRVIASSNRDLEERVRAGTFREELYYRLNIVELRVPPLSERRGDIGALCTRFLTRAAENLGLAPRRLAPDTLAALEGYDWPGNVRQLRNVIDWLLIMTPGGAGVPIGADALPPGLKGGSGDRVRGGSLGAAFLGLPLREARERFEREYLSLQLRRFDGRIARTAEEVGMERTALYRKLRSLRLVEAGPSGGGAAGGARDDGPGGHG